jgi:capsule biosynthesis phosphatase
LGIRREKCLVVDIDGTLCPIRRDDESYQSLPPYRAMVDELTRLRGEGYRIILMSSRNMNTFDGNVGEINAHTLRPLLDWLDRHGVPFDEVHVGKPWAGRIGFYVDDRAIRPDEFLAHGIAELDALVESGRKRLEELEARHNGAAAANADAK